MDVKYEQIACQPYQTEDEREWMREGESEKIKWGGSMEEREK